MHDRHRELSLRYVREVPREWMRTVANLLESTAVDMSRAAELCRRHWQGSGPGALLPAVVPVRSIPNARPKSSRGRL